MIDYRKILKAYMDHVGEREGVFFIGPFRCTEQLEGLSEEESAALMDIYDELAYEPSISNEEHQRIMQEELQKLIDRGYVPPGQR
jgi:hypothetical protein